MAFPNRITTSPPILGSCGGAVDGEIVMVQTWHATGATQPAHTTDPIIEARGLVKRYGGATAVDGTDLVVGDGEIFGILGPNGAGKTNTLEMIEGLRTPDAGTIRVAGLDAVRQGAAVRRIIGVQLQTTALFDYLSAGELVTLFADLYGMPGAADRTGDLLRLVDLEEKHDARVNQMSGGQQQRLSIALALVNEPRVVFLDEPTTGLDPQARRAMWAAIRDINAGGTTVVLTTHYMEEAETLCDRIAIMDRGRIIALDTPDALVRGLDMAATIRARIAGGDLPEPEVRALPAVTEVHRVGEATHLQTTDVQASLVALLALTTRAGVTFDDLTTSRANLEDVFLTLTGRTYEGEAGGAPAETSKSTGRRSRRAG